MSSESDILDYMISSNKIPKLQPSKSGSIKVRSKTYIYGPKQLESKPGESSKVVIAEMQRLAKKGVSIAER